MLILIPVFGAAAGFTTVLGDIALALAKAVLAFVVVLYGGRWLLRPLFHFVAGQRSAELFTLTVLLVSLSAGWATSKLGLSMAFGAFLAGMMLGETEFRHQVEATDPSVSRRAARALLRRRRHADRPDGAAGHLALGADRHRRAAAQQDPAGGAGRALVRRRSAHRLEHRRCCWRSAASSASRCCRFRSAMGAIDSHTGQIVLYSVLLSIIVAPFLIRYNHAIATLAHARA